MARSTLSFGMLLALASATAARSRGLELTSPPPRRAATVISLMMRVKILPRFASAAPFLCLMVLHLLWPDMPVAPLAQVGKRRAENEPRVSNEGRIIPWSAVACDRLRRRHQGAALQVTNYFTLAVNTSS